MSERVFEQDIDAIAGRLMFHLANVLPNGAEAGTCAAELGIVRKVWLELIAAAGLTEAEVRDIGADILVAGMRRAVEIADQRSRA